MRFADKVAVVTGATNGLGRVIAQRLAAEGASLIVHGRDRPAGEALVDELRGAGTDADLVCGDVTDEATADAIARAAEQRYGRIDTMVLNAGTIAFASFWETTPEEYDRMMDVNVRGVWLCARAAVPLLSDGASLVLMSSLSAFAVASGEAVYGASKAAVTQLGKGFAAELASRGIRVNMLCPGAVADVGMTQTFIDASGDEAATVAALASTTPLGRLATPDEVADAALYLAASDSSFVTGQNLVLDGGILLH